MATDIKDIIQNIKEIHMTESSLDSLLNFERVLDELGLYAFKHWKKGELIEGPTYEKYFITCKFMWPYKCMPDPNGAERLLNYDCEVTYQKDLLEFPKQINDPSDFKAGTKVAGKQTRPIWIVSITIPKTLITEIRQGSLELENETLDMEDIDAAYESNDDDDSTKTSDEQSDSAMDQMQSQAGGFGG